MKTVIDNFSERAKAYARFRPVYPENLYQFIYNQVQNFETAWDCGTGNGQVAVELAKNFKQVFATDISEAQLAHAILKPNINYSKVRAEQTNFKENSFDLITVAQAIHWFDQEVFFKEAMRVGKQGAIVAIWGYNLLKITPELDKVISDLYTNILGKYWDSERTYVDEWYSTILFPIDEIKAPNFEIKTEWNIDQLTGYLSSWSAVVKYKNKEGKNPIEIIEDDLLCTWADKKTHKITFPIFTRIGRIIK